MRKIDITLTNEYTSIHIINHRTKGNLLKVTQTIFKKREVDIIVKYTIYKDTLSYYLAYWAGQQTTLINDYAKTLVNRQLSFAQSFDLNLEDRTLVNFT